LPERVREIYDSLPTIKCQGHCWRTCGPVVMSSLELGRVAVARGSAGELFLDAKGHCPILDPKTHKCRGYEARPLLCRLYGVAKGLKCDWGCETEDGRYLSKTEAHRLLDEVDALGGGPDCFRPGVKMRMTRSD
jgi:Fe-S-cluster containining protein